MHLRYDFLSNLARSITGESDLPVKAERSARTLRVAGAFDQKSFPLFTVRSLDFYCERSQSRACTPVYKK
jgi:hypothetical protein